VFLANQAIPEFKTRKIKRYLNAIKNFCDEEVNNSRRSLGTWEAFHSKIMGYNI
jgi:hypothetical protein